MAQPDYVPRAAIDETRVYRSPPRRLGSWEANRPGELGPGQPRGDRFGHPGPDQGYALTLAERFLDRLVLRPGEHADDVLAGTVALALKRASTFGRAPVIRDIEAALTVFGYLDDRAPDDLVAVRRALFAQVAEPHHEADRRAIADRVPAAALTRPVEDLAATSRSDWRSLLDP